MRRKTTLIMVERDPAKEAIELAYWQERPDRMLAYYHFAEGIRTEDLTLAHRPWYYAGSTVSTWPGTVIGSIVSAHVYRHNFGGRFISLRVQGTNGAQYHGRASYDWGTCVMLRRCRG